MGGRERMGAWNRVGSEVGKDLEGVEQGAEYDEKNTLHEAL